MPTTNFNSDHEDQTETRIEGISAVTLATQDMARSLRIYLALEFSVR